MANISVSVPENTINVNVISETVSVTSAVSNVIVGESTIVTNSQVRAALTVSDTGGDGSLTYDNNSGVFTYTGPSQDEANSRIDNAPANVRSHFSATSPITLSSGVIGIDSNAILTGKTTDDLPQGTSNIYFSTSGAAVNTTNLPEGTNLYYTTDRANSAIDDKLDLISTQSTTLTNVSMQGNIFLGPSDFFDDPQGNVTLADGTQLERGNLQQWTTYVSNYGRPFFYSGAGQFYSGYADGTGTQYGLGAVTFHRTEDPVTGSSGTGYRYADNWGGSEPAGGHTGANVTEQKEGMVTSLIIGGTKDIVDFQIHSNSQPDGFTHTSYTHDGVGLDGLNIFAQRYAGNPSVGHNARLNAKSQLSIGFQEYGPPGQASQMGNVDTAALRFPNTYTGNVNGAASNITQNAGAFMITDGGTQTPYQLASGDWAGTGLNLGNITAPHMMFTTKGKPSNSDASNVRVAIGTSTQDADNTLYVAGSVGASGNITTTGNIEGNYILGNGSQLTGLTTPLTNSDVVAHIATVPLTVGGNLDVNGNLEVAGNLNYRNVEDLYVRDQKIVLNANAATDATVEIIANRPVAGNNALIRWDESSDRWTFSADNSTFYILPRSTDDLIEGSTNLYFTNARANAAFVDSLDNITTAISSNANITTTANISGNYILGNGSQLSGLTTGITNAQAKAYIESNGLDMTANITSTQTLDVDRYVDMGPMNNADAMFAIIPGGAGFGGDLLNWVKEVPLAEGQKVKLVGGSGDGAAWSNGSISADNTYYVGEGFGSEGYWFLYSDPELTNIYSTSAYTGTITTNLPTVQYATFAVTASNEVSAQTLVVQNQARLGNALTHANLQVDGNITFINDDTNTFFTVQHDDSGATIGPLIDVKRNSTTAANADVIGGINISGNDSGGNATDYARIHGVIVDTTDTSEKGNLVFSTMDNGTLTAGMTITDTGNVHSDYFIAGEEFIGDLDGAVSVNVRNETGSTLTKGQAVYLDGNATGDTPHVALANAAVSGEMPALGLIKENIANASVGQVVTSGTMNYASHGFAQGEDLFVNTTAGGLTVTAPTGESGLIQKIGKVISANHVIVQGAFRTNATPNLDENNIFIGNSSNRAVTIGLDGLTADVDTSEHIGAADKSYTDGATYWADNVATTNQFFAGVDADTLWYQPGATSNAKTRPPIAQGSKIVISGGSGAEVALSNGSVTADNTYYVRRNTPYAGYEVFHLYTDSALTNAVQTGGNVLTSPSTLNISFKAFDVVANGSVINQNTDTFISENLTIDGDITGNVSAIDSVGLGSQDYTGGATYWVGNLSSSTLFGGNNVDALLYIAGDSTHPATRPDIADGSKVTLSGGQSAEVLLTNSSVSADNTYYVKNTDLGFGGLYEFLELYKDEALTNPVKTNKANTANVGYTYDSQINVNYRSFEVLADANKVNINTTLDSESTIETTANIVTGSNLNAAGATFTGPVTSSANITTTANISGNYYIGNGSLLTGISGGAGGNAFGIVSVSGQSNVTADAATDQITFVAGAGITLTTNASASSVTIAGSGGSYGNTEVANFLDSDTMTANIEYTGNLLVGAPAANANVAVTSVIGQFNGSASTDVWQVAGGQIFTDGTQVTGNSFSTSPLTGYNGNTYYVKFNGTENGYEIWLDAGFSSNVSIGGSSFYGSTNGQAEYVSTGTSQANVEGTLEVTRGVNLATDGSNADFGGNINTGSGSGLYVGSSGVNAIGGGSITMNSVRVTDFKANDPLGIYSVANSSLSGLGTPFTGSIVYVTGDRHGSRGAPAYFDGSNWRYFSDDANVTL